MSDDEKLYRKALSLSDKFEYELAAKFLARILGPYFKEEDKDLLLSKGPPHLEALQLFASLCLELGDVYSSVKVRPHAYLAELCARHPGWPVFICCVGLRFGRHFFSK